MTSIIIRNNLHPSLPTLSKPKEPSCASKIRDSGVAKNALVGLEKKGTRKGIDWAWLNPHLPVEKWLGRQGEGRCPTPFRTYEVGAWSGIGLL
ncbi:hypothetical protein JTE90_024563 [Oedothorax gibbosus]|uniref:Uncharacterized protein n=1 Tax=Oedothorax gibbosus TaxID=931172 RepID=A0AAV6VC51_9ARAC|nr:hypothetical protein JTE90_024563 [Oedothorax gibbosus]